MQIERNHRRPYLSVCLFYLLPVFDQSVRLCIEMAPWSRVLVSCLPVSEKHPRDKRQAVVILFYGAGGERSECVSCTRWTSPFLCPHPCHYPQCHCPISVDLLAKRQTTPPSWTGEVKNSAIVRTSGSICTAPKHFTVLFENSTATCFCLLSNEACLYAGTDLLSSSVSQRVARGQLLLVRWGTGAGSSSEALRNGCGQCLS